MNRYGMATSDTFRSLLAANAVPKRTEFAPMTKNLCDNVNEFIYKLAHEPSLAGHRIQEHACKTIQALAKDRTTITTTTSKLDGVMFDLAYTDSFFNKLDESIHNSAGTREVVSELASKISSARASKANINLASNKSEVTGASSAGNANTSSNISESASTAISE